MHPRTRRARMLAAASALLVPAALLATAQTASAAPASAVALPSTLPRWLPKTGTSRLRVAVPRADASKELAIRVYLTPRGGQDALEQAVAAVSDPASASYGQILSQTQFATTYAPTAASATRVRSWLTAQGLTVTGTEAHRRYVSATGTVAELDSTFKITLSSLTHDKQTVIAPTTAASVPAAVAPSVLTVTGLDTSVATMKHQVTPPTGFLNARPCATSYGTPLATYQADFKTPLPQFEGKTLPYAPCGYTGPSFRSAYEGDSKLDGTGVTVAITDAYRWQKIASDANTYAEAHGDGSYAPGQLTENVPAAYTHQKACEPSGWSGEETLDVEAVHAMAPGANIRYYASTSCFDEDFLDTLGRVVDEDAAQVVTNSWADVESNESAANVVAYEQVFLQGALQGQTFMFSSGDDGDEVASTGLKQVGYPASDSYVTAVGGTSTAIALGKKRFDTGWGSHTWSLSPDGKRWVDGGFLYGAGGGRSALFNQPAYQNGVVSKGASGGRAVPDVAMDADPNTGMLIGQTQKFPDGVRYSEYRIGGTSLASPLLAGMTALTIQQNGGRGFGALNPTLYKTAKIADDVVKRPNQLGVVRANYAVSTDPTSKVSYFVRTFGEDSSLEVTKGWDEVTGIGVPNLGYLALKTPTTAAVATARR